MRKKRIYYQPTPSIRKEETHRHTHGFQVRKETKAFLSKIMRDDTECNKIDL